MSARRVSAAVTALVIALAAPRAHADDATPRAMAESLFEEGRTLLDAGNAEAACKKFAASEKLDPAPGTLLNLGDCYQRLGRSTTAWITFRDAEFEARRTGDGRREEAARDRSAALEPTLSYLVLQPPLHALSGLRVDLDGVALPRATLGQRAPIDPGRHAVHVSAEGFVPWDTTVDVARGPAVAMLAIPPLREQPRPLVVTGSKFWSAPRVTSVTMGSLAVLSASAGIVFGLVAASRWDDARVDCPVTCPGANAEGLVHDAELFADVSTVTFIVAGALLVGATLFWLASPSHPRAAPRAALRF